MAKYLLLLWLNFQTIFANPQLQNWRPNNGNLFWQQPTNTMQQGIMSRQLHPANWWWWNMQYAHKNQHSEEESAEISDRPECLKYNVLNDATRSVKNKESVKFCDSLARPHVLPHTIIIVRPDWKGSGWYRITEPAGTMLPESPPDTDLTCGVHGAAWINQPHPTQTSESVDVTFCFPASSSNVCPFSTKGKVTNCGDFYVYLLEDTNRRCCYGYCGTH